MKFKDDITKEFAESIFRYDYNSGKLFWKERTPSMFLGKKKSPEHCCAVWNACHANKEITYKNNYGYIVARINKRPYLVSRIAWLLNYGVNPKFEIDHINLNKEDNRISNLRLASRFQNTCNRGLQGNNKSGYKGVSFCNVKNKWRARIMVHRKEKFIGYFSDVKLAHEAYKKAAIQYHGEYARI